MQDVVYEAHEELEFLISAYWHVRHGFEGAMECGNPDCHALTDVQRVEATAQYNSMIAELCGQMVSVIEEAM